MRPLTKTAVKVGLALTALEATSRYGLFKDSQAATTGYHDAKDSFLGSVIPPLRPYLDQIPFPEAKTSHIDWTDKWNNMVIYGFSTLSNAPRRIGEFSHSAWRAMSKATVEK